MTESFDRRIVNEMWSGSLPIAFTLAPQELTSVDAPLPSFISCHRQAYLPTLNETIRSHFASSKVEIEDELWFDWSGIPLKWTLPIGVSMDICTALQFLKNRSKYQIKDSSVSSLLLAMDCPLPITVHFQQFPVKRLSRCKTSFILRQHYLSSIKEACYVKFGNIKPISSASPQLTQQLWESIVSQSRESYQSAHNQLFVDYDLNQPSLPVRVFLVGFVPSGATLTEAEAQEIAFLPLQRPFKAESVDATLGDALESIIPLDARDNVPIAQANVTAIIQGMPVNLSTPVMWLSQHLAHPDMFLYIVALKT